MSNANKMWGGRFSSSPAILMQEINQSISFDKALYKQDITGSIAHCKMLVKTKIISDDDGNKIINGLKQIEQEIDNNSFEFKISLEDIHMNIESRLAEIIGDSAGRLHTARSRNDQVALDFRLFVRDNIDELAFLLLQLQQVFVDKAKENLGIIMPGFTHLQLAQPVLFSHHLLAYFEMFKRDNSRLSDLRARLNECPLGACALAGTSFAIDRHFVARELDFSCPTANSMDTVSDRDFAVELLFCLSLIANHLSRFAEEIIIWASKGFAFIKLSDQFTSGSSIMPQKKNPDAAELIRGKNGRISGSLFALLTTLKALPLTYSKDMQEDKEPVFDAVHQAKLIIKVATAMLADASICSDNMLKMASADYSCATDLADWLVKNLHIPFRQAHHITGSIVKLAEQQACDLHQLSLAEMQKICPQINNDIFSCLQAQNSVNSRNSYGGTATNQVEYQLQQAQKYIKEFYVKN
jgi:argininosuccinate lyase